MKCQNLLSDKKQENCFNMPSAEIFTQSAKRLINNFVVPCHKELTEEQNVRKNVHVVSTLIKDVESILLRRCLNVVYDQWRPVSSWTSKLSDRRLYSSSLWKHAYIILTPLNPHFYIVKLGFTGVDIIFLILLKT